MTADQQPALRRTAAPLVLIGSAIGGPQAIAGKLGRLARSRASASASTSSSASSTTPCR